MQYLKAGSKTEIKFHLNGEPVKGIAEPRRLLVDFLRHDLGLTGTHVGCEHGICGACTVLLDGEPIRSCLMFASQLNGHNLVTVEGLSTDEDFIHLRKAFKKHHALQCGFCTPGFLITISAFLKTTHKEINENNIREILSGNICRCTGYVGIVDAVLEVIKKRNEHKKNA